ncbi:bifunctional DNA-formamidopyrimidine glycosylase/DNA-(apurinic or apyrimidinic site) lyase [Corynebacterium otitidis]|uniref:Formamidopyrimidine-DNA glycosylase n=1 Tax=Corynebacterium otitidis ATCC 51513 TaxID=883169 RepID=I7KIN9_9CORY|nr:bifunctional DNA-formamidopyrimidine glycosylase/DNA-(apurinic or apyrimidinic site) lyase [Corynebacterium otitidis]EJZ82877.1 formamidopyrimidine-DNA glycosylase [Corynebacterium otitidis ATCC 51513]KKO83495.1 5-hydroxymethyluracil DNA glycosylase [Corynebacterium otitidis]CCI83060.1 formamidopyrimidine-DNA glycosylase [Corynebacterium otitidis ATCC 51513]
MPELPEVEVVRRGLASHVVGAAFDSAEVLRARSNRGQDGPLEPLLRGRSVTAARRRGKYLWLELSDGRALFIHLGMSGQLRVQPADTPPGRHTRVRLGMTGAAGGRFFLDFVDQRTFGRLLATGMEGAVPAPVAHVAPDPFEESFDPVEVARTIRRKRSEIKRVLLDQQVVSGIGNIYADEALWAAKIRPTKKATTLRQKDALRLLDEARAVMGRALEAGGTSFDELYVNVNGESGYFSRSLNVYGRAGEPCPRCGTPITRVQWTNRSSHYCPACQ